MVGWLVGCLLGPSIRWSSVDYLPVFKPERNPISIIAPAQQHASDAALFTDLLYASFTLITLYSTICIFRSPSKQSRLDRENHVHPLHFVERLLKGERVGGVGAGGDGGIGGGLEGVEGKMINGSENEVLQRDGQAPKPSGTRQL